jgi:hypothetical protein
MAIGDDADDYCDGVSYSSDHKYKEDDDGNCGDSDIDEEQRL